MEVNAIRGLYTNYTENDLKEEALVRKISDGFINIESLGVNELNSITSIFNSLFNTNNLSSSNIADLWNQSLDKLLDNSKDTMKYSEIFNNDKSAERKKFNIISKLSELKKELITNKRLTEECK